MKPGYKTTEFWLSLIVSVLTAVVPFVGDFPVVAQVIGLALTVLTALGYTAARVQTKSNSGE